MMIDDDDDCTDQDGGVEFGFGVFYLAPHTAGRGCNHRRVYTAHFFTPHYLLMRGVSRSRSKWFRYTQIPKRTRFTPIPLPLLLFLGGWDTNALMLNMYYPTSNTKPWTKRAFPKMGVAACFAAVVFKLNRQRNGV